MQINYRAARLEDLPACVDLFEESVTDLRARHNTTARPPQVGAARLSVYRHIRSTGIFHVAEAEGRLAAFACAIVRDDLWFLAGFWARPGMQQQHIGMPLLRGVAEEGKQAGARTFFVWASIDLPAMAAYMKLGMLPGSQTLFFEGAPQLDPAATSGYTAEPLKKDFAMKLDETVLGTPRETDHDFMRRSDWRGVQVMKGNHNVGYYYLHEGAIGPAAWTEADHAGAVLALACREASAMDSPVSMRVPGMNHAAVGFALDSGFQLTGFAHLLRSAPFGRLEQYLPSGPALF